MIRKELLINENDENTGVDAIAIVDEPAIGEHFYYFGEHNHTTECNCNAITDELDTYMFTLTELFGEEDKGQYDSYQFDVLDVIDDLISVLSDIGNTKSQLPEDTNTIVRYRYNGPHAIPTSRSFCKMMLSKKKLFTMQDIIDMSEQLPASLFPGSPGPSTMGLFTYKGGANCRHYWEQVTFKVNENGTKSEQSTQIVSGVNPPAQHKHRAYMMADAEKHIIAGPIMIPDIMIPRIPNPDKPANNTDNEPFEVFFSSDTIYKCSEKYHKQLKINQANEMHDTNMPVKVSLIESWIIADSEKDKSAIYGYTLPVGTWFGLMKVNDMDTWNKIKTGMYQGFSIEGNFFEKEI